MQPESHWQSIYRDKPPERQTWYQRHPEYSLELIERCADGSPTRVVDVGGGASTLVDHLLDRGGFDVTVVDIAPAALEAARQRLGEAAERVEWVDADVTEPLDLSSPFDVWHDRAVFHFLTDADDRRAYLENLDAYVAADGRVVISTFAPDGPEKCSGLPVRRYAPDELAETFGDGWELVDSRRELHETPWDGEQAFVYAVLTRT